MISKVSTHIVSKECYSGEVAHEPTPQQIAFDAVGDAFSHLLDKNSFGGVEYILVDFITEPLFKGFIEDSTFPHERVHLHPAESGVGHANALII